MTALKVTTVGNSLGVILPKEVLDRMKLGKGDTIHLTEAPDGYRVSRADPDFERQMEIAEKIMNQYHNALRELAK
jgi:putative addiction module antidote